VAGIVVLAKLYYRGVDGGRYGNDMTLITITLYTTNVLPFEIDLDALSNKRCVAVQSANSYAMSKCHAR